MVEDDSGVTDLRFLTNKALWHRQRLAVGAPTCPFLALERQTYRLTSGASLPPRLIAWLRFLLNSDDVVGVESRSRGGWRGSSEWLMRSQDLKALLSQLSFRR